MADIKVCDYHGPDHMLPPAFLIRMGTNLEQDDALESAEVCGAHLGMRIALAVENQGYRQFDVQYIGPPPEARPS